jgi:hypothetical protein
MSAPARVDIPIENLTGENGCKRMPIELEASDVEAVFTEISLPLQGRCPRVEDAWDCARRLAAILNGLSAGADEGDRYRFRLVQALVGSLTDELETLVHREIRKLLEAKPRHVGRPRERSVASADAQRRQRSA